MKPLFLVAVLFVAAACNHPTAGSPKDVIGDFQGVPFAHTICISLKKDGRYQELGFLTQVPTVLDARTKVVGVDGLGPIDYGTWSYRAGFVVLHSEGAGHREREFIVEKKDDGIAISQRGDLQNCYFKPNQEGSVERSRHRTVDEQARPE